LLFFILSSLSLFLYAASALSFDFNTAPKPTTSRSTKKTSKPQSKLRREEWSRMLITQDSTCAGELGIGDSKRVASRRRTESKLPYYSYWGYGWPLLLVGKP